MPTDPGANRGEFATGHGGWSTHNLTIDGANTRLAVVAPGDTVTFDFGYTVGVQCQTGKTCPLQLQIGTNDGKDGCAFAGSAIGNFGIAFVQAAASSTSINFSAPGAYAIMVDPAANPSGCGTAWTNGQPTDPNEVIAYVCVAP